MKEYITMNLRSRSDVASRALLHGWLLFAVGCAAVAGLLSVIVAGARIPAVGWLLPDPDMFYIAMVGHVAFGLGIWLLAFVVAMTIYFAREGGSYNARVAHLGLAVAMLGAGIVLGSVLNGQGTPILTDYVPVLETPLFFVGYALFAVGIIIALVNYLPAALRRRQELSLPAFGMLMAVACAMIAAVALVAALVMLAPHALTNYQSLFWGAGHVLQYVYVTTMVATWYVLARAALGALPIKTEWARGLFMLYPLLALPAPFAYFAFDASYSGALRVPGIYLDIGLSAPTFLHLLILAWAVWQAWRGRALPSLRTILSQPEGAALSISVGLYLVGAGLEPRANLGTTQVPAHYHAMVVGGVTTALMGVCYHLLREMKWQEVNAQVALAQLYVFGSGVLLSVVGLASAGSLGAPRKTYDAAVGTAYAGQMNLMGIGAGLAALGGAIFVGSVLFALLRRREPRVTQAVPAVTRQ